MLIKVPSALPKLSITEHGKWWFNTEVSKSKGHLVVWKRNLFGHSYTDWMGTIQSCLTINVSCLPHLTVIILTKAADHRYFKSNLRYIMLSPTYQWIRCLSSNRQHHVRYISDGTYETSESTGHILKQLSIAPFTWPSWRKNIQISPFRTYCISWMFPVWSVFTGIVGLVSWVIRWGSPSNCALGTSLRRPTDHSGVVDVTPPTLIVFNPLNYMPLFYMTVIIYPNVPMSLSQLNHVNKMGTCDLHPGARFNIR